MSKPETLIVTVPDMIGPDDWEPLLEFSNVSYRELDLIDEVALARECAGYDYLMINYDVVKALTAGFYASPEVLALQAISTDITGMDWASPTAAAEAGVLLLNIPHYSTESVAESILAEVLLHARELHRSYVDEIHGQNVQARKGINLAGRVGAVLGLGSIGVRTAELLEAVGMGGSALESLGAGGGCADAARGDLRACRCDLCLREDSVRRATIECRFHRRRAPSPMQRADHREPRAAGAGRS